MNEPVLRNEDRTAWTRLQISSARHAGTLSYRRSLDAAQSIIERALVGTTPAVMWSGGKDSTVMTHLVRVVCGANIPVLSEKDDLDYPGEEAYVIDLARAWGADLRIVRPEISPSEWIAQHQHELRVDGDFHSRAAGLSKACFYGVIERASEPFDTIFLGLRAEESKGRSRSRAVNGPIYRKADGRMVACPLADWSGMDVLTYLLVTGIEPLHVYRCIAFAHVREPWRIRKSWWIQGDASTRRGGVTWLRHYYPSLYRQLLAWFPRAQGFA